MNILDPFQSAEKLHKKWGPEYLPPIAWLRVRTFEASIQHISENVHVQQSNTDNSQAEAVKAVDDILDFEYVNEGPVHNPETVKKAIRSVENADYLADAYQNIAKARNSGEKNAG